jgi:hypothetical protein
MKKFAIFLLLIVLSAKIFAVETSGENRKTKGFALLLEGFEGSIFPPDGWTVQTVVGTGFDRTESVISGTAYEGKATAIHWDEAGDNNNWLITPKISLPATGYCTFSFWQYGYWLNYVTGGYHEVAVSTDMATWDVVYTGHPPVGSSGAGAVWEKIIIALEEYSGSDVYVGFHYVGNYEDQWYIDDVNILYDDEGPQIMSIEGNTALMPIIGAYINNPMILNLSVSDESGVSAVLGHYNIGGQSGDAVFSKVSGTENGWTGTIPAQISAAAGVVYFTLTDIGGIQTVTGNFDIEFVSDENAPDITEFSYGYPVFVNQPMTLTLTFSDQSSISQCTAYYSKNGWSDSIQVAMSPSKIHIYTYSGSLPPETEQSFGEVKFHITDTFNNKLISQTYQIKWLDGGIVFFDDFDANHDPSNWIFPVGSTWGYSTMHSFSPTHSLSDSPTGNYGNNKNTGVETKPIDLSSALSSTMKFKAKYDIEENWDFVYVEGSDDNGYSWEQIEVFTGSNLSWTEYSYNLADYVGNGQVKFRFRLVSDNSYNLDGIYIDDIEISVFTGDINPPIITYSGPELMVIGTEDYVFNVGLTDQSGISMVKLVYSVDGGLEQEYIPPIHSGQSGTYQLTLPYQSAMSEVLYKIVATDNSPYFNTGETDYYKVYFGNYLYYENGSNYIDYLNIIGTSSSSVAYSVATRVTLSPDGLKNGYYANLVGITIANYVASGYPSDPMYVHVWADNGGIPGADLITPFYVEQASTLEKPYAVTLVDLRAYSAQLSGMTGDVFVGFTSSGQQTNVLYELTSFHTSEPGYVAFERSWLGSKSGESISWALASGTVYHISAVTEQYKISEPSNVSITLKSETLELNWHTVPDANSYLIYSSDDPYGIFTHAATVSLNTWSTPINTETKRFYYIVASTDAGKYVTVASISEKKANRLKIQKIQNVLKK